VLRMTRAEIGSYLGLKLETVSRVLSRFAQDNLIEVNQKHVRITNPAGLRGIVAGQPDAEALLASSGIQRRRPRPGVSGNPGGRFAASSVQRFSSNGERERNTVSPLDSAPIDQNAKNPIE
jgi:hypothetical protein